MDAPPPYEQVAGSSRPNNSAAPSQTSQGTDNHLKVNNGIPAAMRRSMEDEGRSLPTGWVRSYDPVDDHQFFVDTTKDPPRSIWHHPYDDETYLNSLESKERERIKQMQQDHAEEYMGGAGGSEDEAHPHATSSSKTGSQPAAAGGAGPSGTLASDNSKGKPSFGRRWKDKITNSTHEEREAERQKRAQQEAQYYERHRQLRQAMVQAQQTGQPQFIGKDPRTGQDIFLEPPNGPRAPNGAQGYNPYAQGPYTNPNARFVRPDYPYARPGYGGYGYGGGYGGGYGLPIGAGLLGGVLLGSVLF